jgi:hypothetical protein
VTLMTTASLPVQLDGEPWRQKPCNMEISLGERLVLHLVHNHVSCSFYCHRDDNDDNSRAVIIIAVFMMGVVISNNGYKSDRSDDDINNSTNITLSAISV